MYTKKCAKFCEVCAHFSLASWYYINRKNPPIHYIVFATPHKKKYLLQKRQLYPAVFFSLMKTCKSEILLMILGLGRITE